MNSLVKALAGALATSLIGVAAHMVPGTGADFIAQRQAAAEIAIGNAGAGTQVSVRFVAEPALSRDAVLSGSADADLRTRVLRAVRAVPGVRSVRWDGDARLTSAPTAAQ